MKIIIVASSPHKSFKETYHLNPSDYFIGIDGGCLELIDRGICPDISIGDFDSTPDLKLVKEKSYDTKFFPKQKPRRLTTSPLSNKSLNTNHSHPIHSTTNHTNNLPPYTYIKQIKPLKFQ